MVKTLLRQMTRRDWAMLLAVSAVFSFCGVFGVSYVVGEGWSALKLWQEILLTIAFTIVFAALVFFVDVGVSGLERLRTGVVSRRLARFVPNWRVRSIALFSLIMVLLWVPWYVANFPGGAYWDTYYQIYQVYPENHPIAIIPWAEIYDQTLTDAWLVDHHPVLVTMLYGAFGWVSDQLTGNWMAGVAVFCGLQGIAHCVVFTASVAYLRRIGCPSWACLIAYLFFALMPFVPTWAMCMVKDSFFALFYVPYFMMLVEAVRTRGVFFGKRSHVVLFVVLAVLMCLTKKQGVFVVVVTSFVGWMSFFIRRRRGRGLDAAKSAQWAFVWQAAVSVSVSLVLFPAVLFPALNIESGGKQEVLGPMFQQTARYVLDYGDEMPDDEREAIAAVVDYDKLSSEYKFDFQDSVKYRYNLDASYGDVARYLGVYAREGLRHPDSYFAAFVSLAGFYVAPTAYVNIRMTTVDTKMGESQRYMLWNPDELDWLRLGLRDAYEAVARVPVLDFPVLLVLYTFWIPVSVVYLSARRRLGTGARGSYGWTVLVAPQLVLVAFCLIAPVYDARYAIPLFDATPLFCCALLTFARARSRMESLLKSSPTL